MSHAALVALCLLSASALAQTSSSTPDAGVAPGGPDAGVPAPAEAASNSEEVRRAVEEEVEAAKRELREEVRAQLATQQAVSDFEQEWTSQESRLELLTLDGYLRVRPKLFHNFDLNRPSDPSGFPLFPRPAIGATKGANTQAGVDMRLRLEPTLNVSEEVAVKMQVDVLDNVFFGSTPETGFSGLDRYQFDVQNETQLAPRSGINSFSDAVAVKRAYGEVSTPVGVLRFGRMGSQWGMGVLYNDGNCLDCDWGDTVDRLQFVTEVFEGFYVAPMLDFNVEGVLAQRRSGLGESVDLTNLDDTHSYVLAIARRDTEQQRKAKLESDQSVFNYGVHFSYRTQRWAATDYYDKDTLAATGVPGDFPSNVPQFVNRGADLYIPDLWVKYERKDWRLELEVAGVVGNIANRALTAASANDPRLNQALQVVQFGGALQGEYRFLEGNLKLQMELGLASGDRAYGLGNQPGRRTSSSNANQTSTGAGDIEGPQYTCVATGGCPDSSIRNFQFDRDYRIDMILWRDLLGSVTDAAYAKPSISYVVAPGLQVFGTAIYSRTLYAESTPSTTDPNLGIELNAGASYETDDGFIASVRYGVLFPLGGLNMQPGLTQVELGIAQSVRGMLGIRF